MKPYLIAIGVCLCLVGIAAWLCVRTQQQIDTLLADAGASLANGAGLEADAEVDFEIEDVGLEVDQRLLVRIGMTDLLLKFAWFLIPASLSIACGLAWWFTTFGSGKRQVSEIAS